MRTVSSFNRLNELEIFEKDDSICIGADVERFDYLRKLTIAGNLKGLLVDSAFLYVRPLEEVGIHFSIDTLTWDARDLQSLKLLLSVPSIRTVDMTSLGTNAPTMDWFPRGIKTLILYEDMLQRLPELDLRQLVRLKVEWIPENVDTLALSAYDLNGLQELVLKGSGEIWWWTSPFAQGRIDTLKLDPALYSMDSLRLLSSDLCLQFPAGQIGLPHLRYLELMNPSAQDFVRFAALPALSELRVCMMMGHPHIPAAIGACKQVRRLKISLYKRSGRGPAAQLPNSLAEMSTLRSLDIALLEMEVHPSKEDEPRIPPRPMLFPKGVANLQDLDSLMITGIPMRGRPDLRRMRNLKYLEIVGAGLKDLPKGIFELPELQTLILHGTDITEKKMKAYSTQIEAFKRLEGHVFYLD